MRKPAFLIASLAVIAATLSAAVEAQTLSAYVGSPVAGDLILTDATGGWNCASIQGAAPTLAQRILNLSPVDTGSQAIGDFFYAAGGATHGRFYVGRPLHPSSTLTTYETLPDATKDLGRVVRLAATGLTGLPCGAGNTAVGDSVRFHVTEPGASYPLAHATLTTDTTIPNHAARQWMTPAGGDAGTMRTIGGNAITADNWIVHVNPRLVSDGDQWTILQAEEYCTRAGGTDPYRVVLMVYSRQYGWDFCLDTMRSTDVATATPGDLGTLGTWNIVTNSGALRIECPRMVQDNGLRQPGDFFTRRITFTIAANGTLLPKPSDTLPTISATTDTPNSSGTWTEALTMVPPSDPVETDPISGNPKWTPFLIGATGTDATTWTQNWAARGSFPISNGNGGQVYDSDTIQTFTPLVASGPPLPGRLLVTGAGANANGVYSFSAMSSNQPQYKNANNYLINWDTAGTRWQLVDPGNAQVATSPGTASLPAGPWSGGITVTAVASPVPILQGRVGRGAVTVQWRKAPPAASIQGNESTLLSVGSSASIMCYYRTGAEWHYDSTRVLSNSDVAKAAIATPTTLFSAGPVIAAGTSFLSSRLQIPKTANTWTHGDGTPGVTEEVPNSVYPHVIVGTLAGTSVTNPEFAPGATTPARSFAASNLMPGSAMHRCPTESGGCGAVFADPAPTNCPYCGTPLVALNIGPGESGVYGTALQAAGLSQTAVTSLATVPGSSDSASHGQRYSLPNSAVRFGPADLFPAAGADTAGNAVNNALTLMPTGLATNLTVQVDIPRFQPPSVPPGAYQWVNDYTDDQGYAGSRMVFNDLSSSVQAGYVVTGANPLGLQVGAVIDVLPPGYDGGNTPGITRFAGNGQWDQYYRCPDCGRLHPAGAAGGCPQDCVALRYTGAGIAYGPATVNPCPGHYFCQTCGNSVTVAEANAAVTAGLTTAATQCPFCGGPLKLIPAIAGAGVNHVMTEADLEAEEFDTFDLQLSVSRKVEVATDQPAVDLGRVSPGVSAISPDTTVGTIASGWPMPFGADASLPVPTSAGNAGNVSTPVRPSYMPAGAGFAADTQVLSRADMDPARYLREGLLCLNPIYVGSVSATSTGTYFVGGHLTPRQADLSFPGTASPWGLSMPSQEPGAPIAASNWMFWQGGASNPLPLGLPVGAYRGQMYTFLDTNNDGYLRFWQKSTGAIATTQTMPFDPEYDIPLQPVTTYGMQTRVTESRLPANDYYANDSSPTARFITTAIGGGGTNRYLQAIWTTNRTNTAALNATVAASTAAPAASPNPYPYNLVYATTPTALVPDNFNPFHDGYGWLSGTDARAITSDAVATSGGSVNASPSTLTDSTGAQWLVWYRRLNHAGGSQSTFEYAPADPAAGFPFGWNASSHIYSTGLAKEHVRGFARSDNNLQWYFWDSPTQYTGGSGRTIFYRWDFNGTPSSQEAPLPVDNSIGLGTPRDFAGGMDNRSVLKPSHSPFVYASTPCPLEMLNGVTPLVSVFFSGYARSTQTSDICWVQFNRDGLAAPGNWRTNNAGKLPFARITDNVNLPPVENYTTGAAQNPGEEFRADGLRTVFSSRHMDWQVQKDSGGNDFGRNYASSGAANDPASWNPKFYLGIVRDDLGDGAAPVANMYMLTWNSGQDTYDRRRGTYIVTPTLLAINGAPALPATCVLPNGQLRDPNAAASGRTRPVTLEIDPAAGTLRFSAPLFNIDNSADPTCVFNTTAMSVTPALADVKVYGSYTPYVYRVTNAGGSDDCPNAFWQGGAAQRLLVFWRRNYSASQAPAAGRSAVMYKIWSTGVSLDHPPLTNLAVTDAGGNAYAPSATDAANGLVSFPSAQIGNQFIFSYVGPDSATCNERHLVLGWSNEMPVPISSVTAESSALTVTPETYQPLAIRGGKAETLDNTRYWLFWSSPRAIFDLRTAASNGQAIHQSGDIFTATVKPQSNTLSREVDTGTVDFNTPT